MGCWNGTCGISNLPIQWNDHALLLIFEKGIHMSDPVDDLHNEYLCSGICHPDDLWRPLAWPIKGRYNDYGSLEKIVIPAKEDFMLYLQHKGVFISDMQDFLKKLRKGKAIYKNSYGEDTLGYTLIRADVWKAVLKLSADRFRFPTFLEHKKSSEKWLRNLANKPKDLVERAIARDMDETCFGFSLRTGLYKSFDFFMDGQYTKLNLSSKEDNELFFNKHKETVHEMAKIFHINNVLSMLRKHWHPQVSCGSQASDWDLYHDFSKILFKISKKKFEEEE